MGRISFWNLQVYLSYMFLDTNCDLKEIVEAPAASGFFSSSGFLISIIKNSIIS